MVTTMAVLGHGRQFSDEIAKHVHKITFNWRPFLKGLLEYKLFIARRFVIDQQLLLNKGPSCQII